MTTCDDGTRPTAAGQVPSFVQIPSPLLYSGIDSDALHLYLILLDKSWKLGCCWPSDRTIGDWLGGKSHDTVNRIFRKLEAAGLVVRTAVPVTGENPSGRLITVNGRVRPPRKSEGGGHAKERVSRHANLRDDSDKKKREYGPPTPGTGAAPEQTAEERLEEARRLVEAMAGGSLARWPAFHKAALEELAKLEAELAAAPSPPQPRASAG
jgi:hypothetical protein